MDVYLRFRKSPDASVKIKSRPIKINVDLTPIDRRKKLTAIFALELILSYNSSHL